MSSIQRQENLAIQRANRSSFLQIKIDGHNEVIKGLIGENAELQLKIAKWNAELDLLNQDEDLGDKTLEQIEKLFDTLYAAKDGSDRGGK
jgi:hypothetical protein